MMKPFAPLLLLVVSGCMVPRPAAPAQPAELDPRVIAAWKREFVNFAAALGRAASQDPLDRVRGLEEAASLSPFQIWDDDQAHVQKARSGDATALKELQRRAEIYGAIQAFWKPYSKTGWTEARERIVSKGSDGAGYLSQVLVGYLLQESYRRFWPEIRYELVEVGEDALGILEGVLSVRAQEAGDRPIGRWDEITQLTAALLGFGEKGWPAFQGVASHPKRYVRVCAARAVVEARAMDRLEVVGKLLLEDPAWEVRAAAATALGDVRAREKSWTALLTAVARERDQVVMKRIVVALGRCGCDEAVPKLINALEVPGDIGDAAMAALYDLTGERITTLPGWQRWYREGYPAWKAKRRP